MPKSEREEVLAALTSRLFSAMLDDLVLDAALSSHHELARSRAICRICHTRCGSVHAPKASTIVTQSTVPHSRDATPASVSDVKAVNGTSGTGTNTPTSVKDGNLYLECVNCNRQIASNRYAPHLNSCMGLASARRGTARNNAIKTKPETGRSISPTSEVGNTSDDSKSKGKSKSKSKLADEAEFNLKRKRLNSPQISPNKKVKKQKPSGSPVSRLKAGSDSTSIPTTQKPFSPSLSASKIPSRLRDSSTASFMDRSSASDSSRSSSPDGISAATPASSSFSHSPNLSSRAIGNNGKTRPAGTGPPKRFSPPRPPPIQVPDYSLDIDGGDETGSSTDSDSS